MSGHPRLRALQGSGAGLQRSDHAGGLVGSILGLAERYLERRKAWLDRRAGRPGRASPGVRRARLRALLTAVGMGAAVMTLALGGRPAAHPDAGPAPQPSKLASCPT